MTDVDAIVADIEDATADEQAEVIRRAATWLLGSVPDRVNRMLAADAYESAVIALAPAGWTWTMYANGCAGICVKLDDDDLADGIDWADTPAMALLLSIVRARLTEGAEHG